MSKYTDLAMERRSQFTPEGRPAWNCCQAVVSVFAQDAGYDEDACMKAATYFRGGMQIGSVCGAITGSLMAIGLAGVDDPNVPGELFRKIKENHNGLTNCRDLLRVNAENGAPEMQRARDRQGADHVYQGKRGKQKNDPQKRRHL